MVSPFPLDSPFFPTECIVYGSETFNFNISKLTFYVDKPCALISTGFYIYISIIYIKLLFEPIFPNWLFKIYYI